VPAKAARGGVIKAGKKRAASKVGRGGRRVKNLKKKKKKREKREEESKTGSRTAATYPDLTVYAGVA